jgi:hypothetical protein
MGLTQQRRLTKAWQLSAPTWPRSPCWPAGMPRRDAQSPRSYWVSAHYCWPGGVVKAEFTTRGFSCSAALLYLLVNVHGRIVEPEVVR